MNIINSSFTIIFATLIILTSIVVPVYASHQGSHPSSPGSGGGGCSTDCTNPTLGVDSRGLRYVEDGFTINGASYNVEHYYQKIPTQTFNTNEQIEIVLHIYENQGIDNLQHVELSLATYNKTIQGIQLEDSISTIIWDEDDNISIVDKTNLLDDVTVTTESITDNIIRMTFSFKIIDMLEPSTIKVNLWDTDRNSWNNYFEDAIQVVEQPVAHTSEKEQPVAHTSEKEQPVAHTSEKETTEEFLKELIQIKDEEKTAWQLLALEYIKNNEFEKAIEIYESLLKEEPNDAIVLNDLGRIYSLIWQDTTANEYYEQALAIDPDSALYRTNYAISLFNIGNYEKSLQEIDKALTTNPDYEVALGMKALILVAMERYNDAQLLADKVLSINPHNVDALTLLAIINMEKENLGSAHYYLNVVTDLDPTFYYAILLQSQVEQDLKNSDNSITSFSDAGSLKAAEATNNNPTEKFLGVKYFSNTENPFEGLVLMLAEDFYNSGEYDKAGMLYETILQLNTHNQKAIDGITRINQISENETLSNNTTVSNTKFDNMLIIPLIVALPVGIIAIITWRKFNTSRWKIIEKRVE